MKPKPGKAINDDASKLDEITRAITEMSAQRNQLIEKIRSSARDAVIVFVDMVGSTQNKKTHENNPELWIYRIRQFYEVITEYVRKFGGRVIKYIGDEVMAVFDGDTRVNDSAGFIGRVAEIEQALLKTTREETSLKVAVDRGRVYLIELTGHDEPDVLGTPVDRCARIAKHTGPGVVLVSNDYCNELPIHTWTEVGEPDLKGIGKTKVFQLGPRKTLDIVEMVEMRKEESEQLKAEAAKQHAMQLLGRLDIYEFKFAFTDNIKITYKSKIRIIFKNETGHILDVGAPTWKTRNGDVPHQAPPVWGWEVDENGKWANAEKPTATIGLGQVFRTWIGLASGFKEDELRRRHESLQLGSLCFPVKIAGNSVMHTIRL
jgi:class 3 adenylate cyclase